MSSKIGIGIPCNRQIKTQTVQSVLDMVSHSDLEFHTIIAVEGFTISENRSFCVAKAVQAGCSHLLFIDDDMTFPVDTADRLLSHGKEIVGTVAHSRMISDNTHITMLDGEILQKKDRPTELFQAKRVGTAVLLIDLKVFNEIDKPFFDIEKHESGFTTLGEDYWFCREAEKKGIEIYVDPTLDIGHIGDYKY